MFIIHLWRLGWECDTLVVFLKQIGAINTESERLKLSWMESSIHVFRMCNIHCQCHTLHEFSPFKSWSHSSPWPSKSFNDRLGVLNLKMGNEGNASVLWWDVCESGLPVIPFVVSNSQQSLPYAECFAAVTLTFTICLLACSRLYLFLIKQQI